jgi:hypothetical protein
MKSRIILAGKDSGDFDFAIIRQAFRQILGTPLFAGFPEVVANQVS